MYQRIFKHIIDRIIAALALIAMLPAMAVISFALVVFAQTNPFFCQLRPGKDGKLFKLMKFKTMYDLYNEEGNLLPEEKRVYKLGSFLRITSLDELPQLVNVIRGEMSIVGPRPLLKEYLLLYDSFQNSRHHVLPGITGWAQVNGRNQLDWDERFKLDVWYTQNISMKLDFKIMLLTIVKLMRFEKYKVETSVVNKFQGVN